MPDAASRVDLSVALAALFRAMPTRPGVRTDERLEGYLVALAGLPLEAVEAAIGTFLRGEATHLSAKYCPTPPELADLARGTSSAASAAKARAPRLYAYRRPNSKLIEANCSKDWAWQLCRQGIHPAGSIWCPGGLNERPDIGDLYGPDPDWRHAVPWPPPSDKPVEAELRDSNAPMFGTSVRRMRDWSEPQRDEPEPPPPRKVPDYSGDKVEITEQLRKSLEMRAALAKVHDDDSSEGGT